MHQWVAFRLAVSHIDEYDLYPFPPGKLHGWNEYCTLRRFFSQRALTTQILQQAVYQRAVRRLLERTTTPTATPTRPETSHKQPCTTASTIRHISFDYAVFHLPITRNDERRKTSLAEYLSNGVSRVRIPPPPLPGGHLSAIGFWQRFSFSPRRRTRPPQRSQPQRRRPPADPPCPCSRKSGGRRPV